MTLKKKTARPVVDYFRQAQQIAFGPMAFQAVRVARDRGLLAAVEAARAKGISPEDLAKACGVSRYASRVLLEGCASMDVVEFDSGIYRLAPVGKILLHDELVRINFDFCNDVCYQGAFHLDESLAEGRPAGLKVFGNWPTIYEGLLQLPPKAMKSWLDFDHVSSDGAFPEMLPEIFRRPVARLLDVGGNTGKWAIYSLSRKPQLRVTLLDHPDQVKQARENLSREGLLERAELIVMDLLDHSLPFQTGFDAVWMSQFLDCFAEEDIVQLLRRGKAALAPEGRLYINETCWDRQPYPAARDTILGSSLYFACMANGKSRMYHSDDLRTCVRESGMIVEREAQHKFHTLFVCRPA